MFLFFMRKKFAKLFLVFPLIVGTVNCTGFVSKAGSKVTSAVTTIGNLQGGYKFAFWASAVTATGGVVYQGYKYYQGYKQRRLVRRLEEMHRQFLLEQDAEFENSYRGQLQERYGFKSKPPVKLTRWESVKVYAYGVYLGTKRNVLYIIGAGIGAVGFYLIGNYTGWFGITRLFVKVPKNVVMSLPSAEKVAETAVKVGSDINAK